jgi:hypothetical protein
MPSERGANVPGPDDPYFDFLFHTSFTSQQVHHQTSENLVQATTIHKSLKRILTQTNYSIVEA